MIGEEAPAPDAAQDGEARPAPKQAAAPAPKAAEGEPLDAMGMFVSPVLQKALPLLGPALVGFGYGYLLGRLRELRR